jgi:hypothetical protein
MILLAFLQLELPLLNPIYVNKKKGNREEKQGSRGAGEMRGDSCGVWVFLLSY